MEQSTWAEVAAAVAASPYPVEVLPADPARAAACLTTLEITTRSWLGAVVAGTGGLLVDHGWLRVLGGGHPRLPDVAAESSATAGLVVIGYDVMGGVFGWIQGQPGARPTVHYFGPDELAWLDLEQGYADWLYAVLAGSLTRFYETLRWPGWEAEVAALGPDEGFTVFPPPFTKEGQDLARVSRRPAPLAQVVSFYQDTARQFGS
ncbi:DUF2625 family protein [Micromonospora auratinigra]|uniref:DUF2625 domain-containing protein n=1 Tax=Micromonospora auratinigra TaxID=261654 RepID=A0A1A9A6W8_9ACTN|nr:DUF2625 family protein [Micromonospora auratinigra]SBT52219.1 Protein of unknown function DUF2625 [Micromonospora auratinigra]